MKLTPKNKQHIDSLSYEVLLRKWRFAQAGDPWFQGETGMYWGERMTELRYRDPVTEVSASKALSP